MSVVLSVRAIIIPSAARQLLSILITPYIHVSNTTVNSCQVTSISDGRSAEFDALLISCQQIFREITIQGLPNMDQLQSEASNLSRSGIGELRVDLQDVYSGILSDNKACYHRPTGFTALLEMTKYILPESTVSYNRHIQFNTTQLSTL